jgi:hypothetical protein
MIAPLMQDKLGLQLDRVVLLGRTFEEYRRYFLVEPDDLTASKVLDVAAGVSSFCAEANNLRIRATAFDPIYSLSIQKIRERSELDLNLFTDRLDSCRRVAWSFYKNPEYMCTFREGTSVIFFSDYNSHPERYMAGKLPRLPFYGDKFDLTLVSYLLFAYQDRFDYEFHRDSIPEIMRVTRGEARVYPTVMFEAQASEYIPMLRSDAALRQFAFTEIKTGFEFLVNSNSFLRVARR